MATIRIAGSKIRIWPLPARLASYIAMSASRSRLVVFMFGVATATPMLASTVNVVTGDRHGDAQAG